MELGTSRYCSSFNSHSAKRKPHVTNTNDFRPGYAGFADLVDRVDSDPAGTGPAQAKEKRAKPVAVDEAALKRTRKQVKMLDDLYKTVIVLITKHYVNEDSDLPAGSAAIALFAAMKKKGWHEVRLLDATGDPLEKNNSPKDGFEKAAVKQLKSGKAYYERVVLKKGKPYLRAATPIPVVLKKCTLCHDNYKNVKQGLSDRRVELYDRDRMTHKPVRVSRCCFYGSVHACPSVGLSRPRPDRRHGKAVLIGQRHFALNFNWK